MAPASATLPRMETRWTFWVGFNVAVVVLLVLDLTVLDRARRGPSMASRS